jgi:flagellar biosynthesis/type III secretory pathway protein FliH
MIEYLLPCGFNPQYLKKKKEGKKEGRMEGRKEGWKGGKKGGREEGRKRRRINMSGLFLSFNDPGLT